MVDTIFSKEKQSKTPQAAPETSTKEQAAAKAEAEAILKPKVAPTKSEEQPLSTPEPVADHQAKKEEASHNDATPATKHTHKGGKKHYHKKGGKR